MRAPARATIVVWTAWALMLGIALVAIARYGPEIPRAEDWLLVPALTGHEVSLLSWLWEQNSEHRVPLPRLAYLALLKLTGGDFRAGMVFDTLAIAALAGGMMLAARRLRGRTSYADAFFPLVLLHLGHWDNLVWSWQIQFVLSTLAAGVLLLIIATRGGDLTPLPAALAAACLVALPLCGANGLALTPFLSVWFAYAALSAWRDQRRRAVAALAVAAVAIASLLGIAYFVAYERASWYPPSPGPVATLKTAAQFLAMAFGPGALAWRHAITVLTLGLLAATALLLVKALRSGTIDDRRRALGLVCIMLAIVALAVAVAWGRAGRVAAGGGLSRRYALLAAPILCAVFFAWQVHASGRWVTRLQASMLLVAVALLPANTASGLRARDWVRAGMEAVQHDIDSGMPLALLAERHQAFLLHWDGERLANGMRMLREARIPPFAGLRDEFTVEEIGVGTSSSRAGDVTVDLDGPRRVYAVRLRVPSSAPPAEGWARIAWKGQRGGPHEDVTKATSTEPGVAILTVWINDIIEGFRIQSENPATLGDARVVLIVPRT